MQYDPIRRFSADECLQHEYFINTSSQAAQPSSDVKYEIEMPSVEEIYNASELLNLRKTTLRQYSFLRGLEVDRSILPPLSVLMNDLLWSFDMREKMAAWVIEITSVYEPISSCQRTAYFAIALIDAYYAKCLNGQNSTSYDEGIIYTCSMDLVGACCMHIASKCEDVSYIGIRDLAMSLPDAYAPAEFLLVEEEILNIFQFDLYLPTVIDFLGLFLECLPAFKDSIEIQTFCKYLGMLTLLHFEFNEYEPSRIATAIASYSLSYNSDGTKNQDAKVVWVSELHASHTYINFKLLI